MAQPMTQRASPMKKAQNTFVRMQGPMPMMDPGGTAHRFASDASPILTDTDTDTDTDTHAYAYAYAYQMHACVCVYFSACAGSKIPDVSDCAHLACACTTKLFVTYCTSHPTIVVLSKELPPRGAWRSESRMQRCTQKRSSQRWRTTPNRPTVVL